MSEDRVEGWVKWFNHVKGEGMIERFAAPDVYVHHTAIVGEGFRNLAAGDHVEFSVVKVEEKWEARDVRRL